MTNATLLKDAVLTNEDAELLYRNEIRENHFKISKRAHDHYDAGGYRINKIKPKNRHGVLMWIIGSISMIYVAWHVIGLILFLALRALIIFGGNYV